MTFEIIFVFVLLAVAIFLFVTDYVTVDVTAIIIMACLLASGILTPTEGLLGFSNPATELISGFFLPALFITVVMSNNASAALLAPIAIEAASSIQVNEEAFLYAVTFAASLSLITPFGYQTNTMIYGPGQYSLKDFFKVGIPLNIIFWVLATIFIPIIWPF